MKESFFYDNSPYDKSYEAKVSMIQKLYLPELDEAHYQYKLASAAFGQWIVEGRQEILEKMKSD